MDGTIDSAIEQVSLLQHEINQALVPGSGLLAVQHLQNSQLHVQRLQQLAVQLQQVAAAVQQAVPSTAHEAPSELVSQKTALQQQAKSAMEALELHVTASLSGPCPLLVPKTACPQHCAGHSCPQILWDLLHRVGAAAPCLQIHLFRSSVGRLLCSYEAKRGPFDSSKQHPERQSMDAAAVSHVSAFVEEVRVVCPGVFVAAIALAAPGLLQPVRVCFDAADRASSADPWTSSKHQVFKRISQLATRAVLHFQHLQSTHALLWSSSAAGASTAEHTVMPSSKSSGPEGSVRNGDFSVALEAMLLWLGCYDDLFTRPCDVSGSVLVWAADTATPLPPYIRPYWLSLEGLRVAASSKAARRAYHVHVAPWPKEVATAASSTAPAAPGAPLTETKSTLNMTSVPTDQQSVPAGPFALPAGAGLGWDDVYCPADVSDDDVRNHLRRVIGDIF